MTSGRKRRSLGNPVGIKDHEGYFFLLPLLIVYMIFTFSMLVVSFGLSFTNYKLNRADIDFVGLRNYIVMFGDEAYWSGLKHTLYYVALSAPLLIVLPFLLASLINVSFLRGKPFFRATFFYPQVIAVSIVTVIASYMFQPYTGLVNGLLKYLGLLSEKSEIMWLSGANVVWYTIVIISLWRSSGYNMILYLAGMQDISESYYEAADIEGASGFRKLIHITIPCLSNVHVLVIFLQLISSFKIFSQIYLLTEGGPSGATRTYIQYLYETAFNKWQLGRGSAAAVILFLIIMAVTQLQQYIARKATSDK